MTSVCKKCRERETGELFAVKIISAHGKLDEALQEAELLRRVQGAARTSAGRVPASFCLLSCSPHFAPAPSVLPQCTPTLCACGRF